MNSRFLPTSSTPSLIRKRSIRAHLWICAARRVWCRRTLLRLPVALSEYFRIPRDVLTLCVGKSTYARCGIIVNVTPLEPEWEGHVTLEISNTTPLPARIYANEGLAQVIFLAATETCETSYANRAGKYQGQQGITVPQM